IMNRINVTERDGKLILDKSRQAHSFELLLTLLVAVFIAWLTLSIWNYENRVLDSFTQLIYPFLFLLPLGFIPKITELTKIVMRGEMFEFDLNRNEFLKDGKRVFPLDLITGVRLRVVLFVDSPNCYYLGIVHHNGKKYKIDECLNEGSYLAIADAIAFYCKVDVKSVGLKEYD
ncbi:MAG: hypothetical protein ACREH5_05030, partial [Candidatus Omnitrophota bacterium]